MDASASREHVAVIVVHGVADQPPGETAGAVSRQLACLSGACVTAHECTIEVRPIDAAVPYPEVDDDSRLGRTRKALAQSLRSDFLAQPPRAPEPPARKVTALDPGARFTDYLFWKARYGTSDPSPPAQPYPHQAAYFEVRGRAVPIDVFEMYWADLSRLSGAAPRILTELFTLLFNLSRLGAQTVALAAALDRGNRALRWLDKAQRAADWLYSRIFAIVVLQLLVCAVMVLAASLAPQRLRLLAVVLMLGAVLFVALLHTLRKRSPDVAPLTAIALLTEGLLVYALIPPFALGVVLVVLWMVCVVAVQERLFSYWERRFRGVYGWGLAAALATLAAGTWGVLEHGDPVTSAAWTAGALRAVDVWLYVTVGFWFAMLPAVTCMVVCGSWATATAPPHAKETVRNTVGTGRLGLLLSLGAFIAFAQTLWALMHDRLVASVTDVGYRALLTAEAESAKLFLVDRYENATVSFSLIAMCVGLVVAQLAITLLPSIVVELRIVRADAPRRLRRWLTKGYALFDCALGPWAYAFVAVVAVGVVLTTMRVWYRLPGAALPGGAGRIYDALQELSAAGLAWVVFPLVGAATGLIAIGGLAFAWLQRLRAPVDVALDVDNHFREFPRRAIPRVRIFERYAALLDHVLARGYGRIVIVAHSQGTVITAELLRYLQQRAGLAGAAADPVATLAQRVSAAGIALFTLGSPLRQLYARRFPCMYGWMAAPTPRNGTGPRAADLGVAEWVNRWGAADYVGRWLWQPRGPQRDADRCTGADAHTHYFETDQVDVLDVLARLTR